MKILFPNDSNLTFSTGTLGRPYRSLQIPYAETLKAHGGFGTIILQHFKDLDFDIGYQLLLADKPISFGISFDKPVLMLSYLLDGEVAYLKERQLDQGVVKAGTYHLCYEYEAEHPVHFSKGYVENFFIIFSEHYLEKLQNAPSQVHALLDAVYNKANQPLHSPFYKVTARIRKHIKEILSYSGEHTGLFIQSHINDLLLLYLNSVATQDFPEPIFSTEREKLKAITEFIEHALDRPLTVQTLARSFGFSVTALHKKFKKVYGVGLYQYIRDKRLSKAKALLTSGNNFPLTRVADMCGYPDVSNFCAAFKKRFGHNTGHYRMAGKTLR